ncbi:MAG: DUF551 domain-containing protein [Oscillibacter sp.]|nr:DUF551 domain-containing protein [Oscillibacter sp.]
MTREEQIKEAGIKNCSDNCAPWSLPAFMDGARWADEYPKSPWISVEERLPEENGYYLATDGNIVKVVYFFKAFKKFAKYRSYPHPIYKEGVIKLYMPIPSFR